MTNSKTTKKALLSSVVALLLCFTMLLGTTFAWFTDTASTSVNTIQAGTLDVTLEMKEGNEWVTAEGQTLNFVKAAGHESEAILWEPGCTYNLPTLRVGNNGNLALKYKVGISGINGDAKLNEAIEWTIKVGNEVYDANTELHLTAGQTAELTISGHMKDTAGNEYQGLSIDGVAIAVYATQDAVEYDSQGNQYDAEAEYSTADVNTTGKLITAGSLTINENISVDSDKTEGNSDAIRVTGGNHVITGGTYTATGSNSNSALRVDGGNVTIKGGNFEVAGENNCIYAAGGNITIEGGTFKSEKAYNGTWFTLNCKDSSGGTITVKGGKFYMFNPAEAGTQGTTSYVGSNEIKVAEGYKVVSSGEWYYVVPNDATTVSDSSALSSALTTDGYAVLTDNVTTNSNASYGNNAVGIQMAAGATLDGNGHTLSKGDKNGFAILTAGGTIKNVKLNDSARAIFIDAPTADTVLDNVTIDGAGYAINTGSQGNDGAKLTVTNSTINGWTSFANLASASFANCSFGSSTYYASEVYQHYLRPYVSATFTNCSFDKGFYIDLTQLGEGCTVTLTNCTCNGVTLTKDNFADYVKIIKTVENGTDVYAANGDDLTNLVWG